MSLRLYMLQRITALIMAPLVLGHLVVMVIAIQGGLTAAEILSRTHGSVAWFLFYGSFVLAVSIHGAIGLRGILGEWLQLRKAALDAVMWLSGVGLLALGLRATWAVTFGVLP